MASTLVRLMLALLFYPCDRQGYLLDWSYYYGGSIPDPLRHDRVVVMPGGQFADDVARIASREASSVDDVTRAIDDAARQSSQSRDDLARQSREGIDRPVVPAIESRVQAEDVATDIARSALCEAAGEVLRTGIVPSAERVGQATFENLVEENVPRLRAQALARDVQAVFSSLEAGDPTSALFELQLLLIKHRYC